MGLKESPVNRRYQGLLWDVAGVVQITDIRALETFPVNSDGSDERPCLLSKPNG